jgi:D-glycero-alpha-D-manno-heptose 1-phosphate guanylyltransferase
MTTAIVLAGGLGTRLRTAVPDLPKPMATVAGKPFLWWLFNYLQTQGVVQTYLSVGYKREAIVGYFGTQLGEMRLEYVLEEYPLGTGGAIAHVLAHADIDSALVLNGDTLAMLDIRRFMREAQEQKADIALAAALVTDTARYGAVQIDPVDKRVIGFTEKGNAGPGYINAGVYMVKRDLFVRFGLGDAFSLEHDLIKAHLSEMRVVAFECVTGFIDIGIPDDYARAQTEVPAMIARF